MTAEVVQQAADMAARLLKEKYAFHEAVRRAQLTYGIEFEVIQRELTQRSKLAREARERKSREESLTLDLGI